jgi:hypothetical protein
MKTSSLGKWAAQVKLNLSKGSASDDANESGSGESFQTTPPNQKDEHPEAGDGD